LDRHATPRLRAVAAEQVRVVGLSLRWLGVVALAVIAVITALILTEVLAAGRPIDFNPEQVMVPGPVALLLPIFIWKDEDRFGSAFLWTLPVDRRQHALVKVFAGWVWLMAAVACFVLWLLAMSLVSGDRVLAEELRGFLPVSPFPEPGTIDRSVIRTVRWAPQPILWLVPFTAATATYLLGSALMLGPRHPLRWVVGTVLAFFLLLGIAEATSSRWLLNAPNQVLRPLFIGPYGLDAVLTARTDFLKVGTTLTSGESAIIWRGFPNLGQLALATLLWTGAGLLALWAAASRHRERRSG
jgi:hypothetical protein